MTEKILVANRGEIACRILRTLKGMGIPSVAVYSDADRFSQHVTMADEAFLLGPAPVRESYLNQERLFEIMAEAGVTAVHPGYGLLSENAAFAEACESRGIAFGGPAPEQIRTFGLKHRAREIAESCDVPVAQGTPLLSQWEDAIAAAEEIGYPVMLKSTAGGGGIGIRVCHSPEELKDGFETVERLSQANFGDGGVFLERFVERARHVEVQIFGDGKGKVIALGERDCSAQRRNQKVLEESPAPNLPEEVRKRLWEAAVRLGEQVSYRSAGTVEFLYDTDRGEFFFLEVNTRLQVEHGVTELVTGVDLVEWMVRLGNGSLPPLDRFRLGLSGHAIEARIYAEDPNKDFQPSPGLLTHVHFPTDCRVDTWVETGSQISSHYDPLLAKILAHGDTREAALANLSRALAECALEGIETNLRYLRQLIANEVFTEGRATTRWLNGFEYLPATVDVVMPGSQTTIQDYPGRLGYWEVGVPPSGPMDSLAFRVANRLAGNPESAAGLEIALTGPTLRFNQDAVIAIAGAPIDATLDGRHVPLWTRLEVRRGQTLALGLIGPTGMRSYLAIRGGFEVSEYLGSRSTFILGQFGGHGGRILRPGDVLPIGEPPAHPDIPVLEEDSIPTYGNRWVLRVLYGPHAAPDFFEEEYLHSFFREEWKVHYNSDRTGIRLIGPKPQWTRPDGGEAGLHPSNIHDNAYAIGTVDFTGDMPVLLGPDGPSLGGFVCPATLIRADLWKMGQLRAGDKVRFQRVDPREAQELLQSQEAGIETLSLDPALLEGEHTCSKGSCVPCSSVVRLYGEDQHRVVFRPSGDSYLLIEFGPLRLDFNLRFRVQLLYEALRKAELAGVLDLTPGIRSLQVHYDSRIISQAELLETVEAIERSLLPLETAEVPSRVVHLPLSWNDPSTIRAIEKYMQSVRPDAPWCPSNIEFIRRINGLDSIEDVQRIVFDANYVVLGLGDVYLGAPVATPLDPRHRLVTTKYNPARTWTPENAVGIGGAYLCVYGMEGPGGYQFVGRTVQMWNRYRETPSFQEGKPWLLRFFDQIRFFPVTADELKDLRQDFVHGRYNVKIEPTSFRLADYNQFLRDNRESIAAFKESQQQAFEAEREHWKSLGLDAAETPDATADLADHGSNDLPENAQTIESFVAANVWKLLKEEGDRVEAGERVAILEAMKTEFPVAASGAGTIRRVLARENTPVEPGQALFVVEPDHL